MIWVIIFLSPTDEFYGIACCHARFTVRLSWRHLSETWPTACININLSISEIKKWQPIQVAAKVAAER